MTRKITGWLILAVTAVAIVYDIVIVIEPTPGDTISRVTLDFAWVHPFVSYAMGVLVGHLMWPMAQSTRLWRILILAATGAVVLGLDIAGILPRIVPIIPVLIGIVAGHYLWTQKAPESP